MNYYLAIDIGASSGRHIVGWLENNEIKTNEVYRFKNGTKNQNGHLIWDISSLFDNVVKGIRFALKKYPEIKTLAIDTWGVDYVLLSNDVVIMPCLAYLAAYSIIKQLQAQGNANKVTLDRLNNWCADKMGCMPIPL